MSIRLILAEADTLPFGEPRPAERHERMGESAEPGPLDDAGATYAHSGDASVAGGGIVGAPTSGRNR